MASGPGMLLVDVAERGDVPSVMTAVNDTLRAWVGVGPVFLATADPVTGSFTGTFTFGIPQDAAAAFFAIEMAGRDVVQFGELAHSNTPLGSLYAATGDSPETSERWREVISPLGWGDELRGVVRAQGSTWGYLCVHREAGDRPFSAREFARLNALLPAISVAMRRSVLSSPADTARLDTGVVLVDHRGHMMGATGGAAAWLDELGPCPPDGLPLLLAGLIRLVFDSGVPVTTTITTRTGRVGVVDAALMQQVGEPCAAVVISTAPPDYQLERLGAASGLSVREREVVSCVLDGLSTRAIADRLTISPHTVQAHLTSVFAKTGLRSRRELISRLSR